TAPSGETPDSRGSRSQRGTSCDVQWTPSVPMRTRTPAARWLRTDSLTISTGWRGDSKVCAGADMRSPRGHVDEGPCRPVVSRPGRNRAYPRSRSSPRPVLVTPGGGAIFWSVGRRFLQLLERLQRVAPAHIE